MCNPRHADSNPLGFVAFICALVGLLTGGILSPVGLILSLFALGKHPRGFAVAGLVLGLLGSGCVTAAVVGGLLAMILAAIGLGTAVGVSVLEPRLETTHELESMSGAIHAYYQDNKALPEHLGLLVPEYLAAPEGREPLTDPWHKPYRYEISPDRGGYRISSDGPDGKAGTEDDSMLDGRLDSTYVPNERPKPEVEHRPAKRRPRQA